jgi:putative membrane protein
MWYMHEGAGWWMLFGGIWMVIFWGGLIALVIWGINRLAKRAGPHEKSSAMDIARERYARGEITKEQFEQIKKDLG